MFNLYNFVAYQLVWFAVILGAANDLAVAGTAVAVLVTATHLWLQRERAELPAEVRLIGAALFMGLVIDSTLAASDQVRFADAGGLPFAPFWMLALWMAFATTLNHSLLWLMRRPIFAAIGGAVFGPLAYLAGERLGALTLSSPSTALPLLAALWAVVMTVFSLMTRQAVAPATRSIHA